MLHVGSGSLDQRVTFRKRALQSGEPVGDFADAFTCWARWWPASAQQIAEAGAPTDAISGTLTIRDTPAARTLAELDRAVFCGQDLCIVSAPIPDRSGYLTLQLTRKIAG